MNLITSILLFITGISHDIQIAYFKIYPENENLKIEFIFEYNDLSEIPIELNKELNDKIIQEYISSNFLLSINNSAQKITFDNTKLQHKHLHVVGHIDNTLEEIKVIDIKNTCLINIDDHSNIIEIHLNSRQRDFLMNKDRTTLQINY